jgi:hypothetical protein
MEEYIFSDDYETESTSDLLFDIEEKFDSIINSIEKLLNGNIIKQDLLKDIKIKCEMHVKCVKQISRLEMIRICKHEYITDMIDTDPEKSQMITYCIFCESTKPSEGTK